MKQVFTEGGNCGELGDLLNSSSLAETDGLEETSQTQVLHLGNVIALSTVYSPVSYFYELPLRP